jgi:nicotinamide-nucleotide amidase
MTTLSALCIGDELLDGRIHDKNAGWLAAQAADQGLSLRAIRMVGDDVDAIVSALDEASSGCDLIICSGGLGPTADDLTHEAAAKWVGADLELDEQMRDELERRFEQRGYPFTPNNLRQCTFPEGAEILPTQVGTAAGFSVQKDGCRAVFLPGVPPEFRWFVNTYILPEIGQPQTRLCRERLAFFGPGESQLESKLDGIEELAERLGARVGYRAAYPVNEVHLKAGDEATLEKMRAFVLERVGRWLVSQGDTSVAARIGEALLAQGATVTAAESCTAGRVAAKLTEVSGSSGWFERGFITYANAAKTDMLGVHPQVLEKFGAVSPQTVCQMASGARRAAGATYAVATSGIAGPTGGTPQKPVGTVHFALATPHGVWHRLVTFPNRGRERTLTASVYTAASLLLWQLEDRLDEHRINGPFSDDDVWAPEGIRIDESNRETP